MIGFPLPRTSSTSLLLRVIPGTRSSTSLAEPTWARRLFSTVVTRASPFSRVTGRSPFTTTSANASVASRSVIVPKLACPDVKGRYLSSKPINETFSNPADGVASSRNAPLSSVTPPVTNAESVAANISTLANGMGRPDWSETWPVTVGFWAMSLPTKINDVNKVITTVLIFFFFLFLHVIIIKGIKDILVFVNVSDSLSKRPKKPITKAVTT